MNGILTADRYRRRQDRAATLVVAVVCGLGFVGAVFPAVEYGLTVGLTTLAALALVGLCVRWVARVRRERREDRDDALAAIAWRAQHMPHHPLAARDRTGLHPTGYDRWARDRAGVS
jgi:hypothetical protein